MSNVAVKPIAAVETRERNASEDAAAVRRRVMHVTWSMVAGGAEVYALNILRHLDPARFTGGICAIDQGGALESEFAALGIPTQIMHRKPGVRPSLFWRLCRLFHKHRVSVVHTHHFNQLLYSALGAKLTGATLIHTEHSVELFDHWRRRLAMRWLCRLADQVLVVGPDVKKFMLEQIGIPETKLRVVYAGVTIPRTLESQSSARTRFGYALDTPIVLIVARLFPEKNHCLLLDAFRRIVNAVPSGRLLIAGAGTEEEMIRRQIQRLGLQTNVDLLGVRRDVPALLAAADVVVLPSKREGLPLIILEAMACARPVVASRVGEIPEAIEDGITGRLIKPDDTEALVSGLLELINDPVRAEEMGRRGREAVTARFDIVNMVAAHEALYA